MVKYNELKDKTEELTSRTIILTLRPGPELQQR